MLEFLLVYPWARAAFSGLKIVCGGWHGGSVEIVSLNVSNAPHVPKPIGRGKWRERGKASGKKRCDISCDQVHGGQTLEDGIDGLKSRHQVVLPLT